jgi:hypothetical protein
MLDIHYSPSYAPPLSQQCRINSMKLSVSLVAFLRVCFYSLLLAWILRAPCPQVLLAQAVPRAVLSAQVLDDSTGVSLPLANVFIANSTIGAATDTEGKCRLTGIPLGIHQVAASLIGYIPAIKVVHFADTVEHHVQFRLKPQAVPLPGIVVEEKDPKEWKANLQRFIDAFLGSTPNATHCIILNPQVLDFAADEANDQFSATARGPLFVDNHALGYRCQFFLDHFTQARESSGYFSIQFIGVARFEPLQSQSQDQVKVWKANRERTFMGSKRHFLAALVQKNTRKQGFEVNRIHKTWIEYSLERRSGFSVDADTLIAPGLYSYQWSLRFPELLQVLYTHGRQRSYSIIELDRPSVTFYSNGLLDDPLRVLTYGFWAYQRFADMLPIDYQPD